MRAAEAEVATVRRDKAQIEVRIARQRAQYVDAPIDGTVLRLLANAEQGGVLVRPGERLAVLVPDVKSETAGRLRPLATAGVGLMGGAAAALAEGAPVPQIANLAPLVLLATGRIPLTGIDDPGIVAELQIDGNDFPLVRVGDPVRLQFEGWPAAQFVGWPSIAVGTFGGRVFLVDPTANDQGEFRVLVEPDPNDRPWPDSQFRTPQVARFAATNAEHLRIRVVSSPFRLLVVRPAGGARWDPTGD